ncbi:MAG: PIG-L family deacetylase [Spirochaetales bacterium]|jgi:N-acetylglucosamine malate deacetylase 1|nr:PIG-L family deacetylase [Spirochaetales bacterium]
MNNNTLNLNPGEMTILAIGAHPDDCEISCSGAAALWAKAGNRIIFLSMTDGRSGHHILQDDDIVARRAKEASAAAKVINAESRNLKVMDGFLEPTLENRLNLIREIRGIMPDVIITNRPNDYHPDHRYTAQLVQDSAYLFMVPHLAADITALRYNPVILYWDDTFKYPKDFEPNVVLDIDPVMPEKMAMIHEHESQVYEWLPYVSIYPVPVPESANERKLWLAQFYNSSFNGNAADRYRGKLEERYGGERAKGVQYAEAFELCEYGTRPDQNTFVRIFEGL